MPICIRYSGRGAEKEESQKGYLICYAARPFCVLRRTSFFVRSRLRKGAQGFALKFTSNFCCEEMGKSNHSLWNGRGDELLIADLQIADVFFSRLRGLLGRSGLGENEGLLITKCHQVHMMFMRFPIDMIFCAKNNLVVHVEESLRPWKISPTIRDAAFVIELAAGSAKRLSIKAADRLEVRSNTHPS